MSNFSAQAIERLDAPVNMLLLEDSDFDRRRIRRLAKKSNLGVTLHEVTTLDDLQAKLNEHAFDVILLDYKLTDGSGLDALGRVKNSAHNKDTAVIMITGEETTDLAVSAFRQGCQDFLRKSSLSPRSFQSVIATALRKTDARRKYRDQENMLSDIRNLISQSMTRHRINELPTLDGDTQSYLEDFLTEMHGLDDFDFRY